MRIKQKRPWSAEDDGELRRLAALRLGAPRISAKLKRTPLAIESRAAQLGIVLGSRPRVANSGVSDPTNPEP